MHCKTLKPDSILLSSLTELTVFTCPIPCIPQYSFVPQHLSVYPQSCCSPSCVNHSISHSVPKHSTVYLQSQQLSHMRVIAFGVLPHGLFPSFYGRTFSVPLFPALTSAWHLFSFLTWKMHSSCTGWAGRTGGKVCGSPSP